MSYVSKFIKFFKKSGNFAELPIKWIKEYLKNAKDSSLKQCIKAAFILILAILANLLTFIGKLVILYVTLIIFYILSAIVLTTSNNTNEFQSVYLNLIIFAIGVSALLITLINFIKNEKNEIIKILVYYLFLVFTLFISFITGFSLIGNMFIKTSWIYYIILYFGRTLFL